MSWRRSPFTVLALVAACRATPTSSGRAPAADQAQQEVTETSEGTDSLAPTPYPPVSTGPSAELSALSLDISLQATQIALGDPLPLRVQFKNEGAAATTLREPPRTWELALWVFGSDTPRTTPPTPFGKIFHETYAGLARRTIEDAARISLEPGDAYTFVEDVGTRWPQLFSPGARQLQVIDRSTTPETRSNVVSVQVLFAESSMPKLFEFVERPFSETDPARQSSEDGQVLETRRFAARWIAELQPGFELDVDAADATGERNRATVVRARALWERQRGTREIRAKIDEINRNSAEDARRK